uniref:HscB mitochondrial iron-sulfur cluster cochaperone n=1 Tax=Crocodylus porosus TaxID=8502 RepID=A0A7M4EU82_CROPO
EPPETACKRSGHPWGHPLGLTPLLLSVRVCRCLDSARAFGLDVSRLRRRFRSLQRALHPDYFSRRPQAERDLSQQHSALVNAAYQTLLRPLSRGLYLLELHGVKLAEGTDDNTDMEFLAEIMDINEKLADPENEASLQELESLIAGKLYMMGDFSTVCFYFILDDLQEAKKLLAKMKYFANLEDKVKSKKIPS